MSESFDEFMERKRRRLEGEPKPKKERTPLKKGKGLNPVSKKQSAKLRLYKKARELHYGSEENRSCAICGATNGLSVHHIEKRGDNIADSSKFITLCIIGDYMANLYPELNSGSGGCHGFIEANKSWAREHGYLK